MSGEKSAMKNVVPMHSTREEQQERHPSRAAVRERAEDRRDQRIDPDADDDRDRQEQVPVALAELVVVDQVQPDRTGHDGEREDRVGEVVQRPRRGTTARPLGVSAPRPRPRAGAGSDAGPRDGAALVTGR